METEIEHNTLDAPSNTFKIWPIDGKPIIVDIIDSDLDKNEQPWKLRRIKTDKGHTFVAYRLNLNPRNMDEIIASRIIGRPIEKGDHILHLDGDHLNNTRANLKVMSSKELREYRKKQKDNQSG